MSISVCITAKDSKEEIVKLLKFLDKQLVRPKEVVLVNAEKSKLQNLNTKKNLNFELKIINKPNISRGEGRNLAVKTAKNEIIVMTDVGCIPRRDWLERITEPIKIAMSRAPHNDTVVAGWYEMTYENNLQKAMSIFLGPNNMPKDFLPSTRSIAFTKSVWKKAGGFPDLNIAEDTVFNYRLLKNNIKIVRAKDAVVEWQMPGSVKSFQSKVFKYALGDLESGIWWHPVKRWKTHNLKVISILLRYLLAFGLLAFGLWKILLLYALFYMLYAYNKAKWWGIVLQFVSDIAIISSLMKFTNVIVRNEMTKQSKTRLLR
jgi:cellulose synthase/poly-beta-1,6-N-acetylglucosamine synthase-like glycosyltransferase